MKNSKQTLSHNRRRKKKIPLGTRILRFVFGRPLRIALLFILILLATGFLGFWIYAACCNMNASWEDIPSPPYDTIPALSDATDSPIGNGFAADLSAYEKYFNPTGTDQNAFLRLVSKEFPLKKKDVPDDLTPLSLDITNGEDLYLRLNAAKSLEAMLIEMRTQEVSLTDPQTGLPITVLLGYRSYTEQKERFDSEVARQMQKDPSLTKEMAEQLASVTVVPPGLDEFQTGLSVAFAAGNNVSSAFANTDAYRWLKDNSWKFGFILRYPDENQPWQFRFVGRIHAELMVSHDLTLEEYLDRVIL